MPTPFRAFLALSLVFAVQPAFSQTWPLACGWIPGHHPNGLGSTPRSWIVFDDGQGPALYAAGEFETADEAVVGRVAKWDGTSWTALGDGFDRSVHDLEVFDDGTGPALYASGAFTASGDTPMNGLAKWDGTAWSAFAPSLESSQSPAFSFRLTLEVFDDGAGDALYVGGIFDSAGGVSLRNIAKWDGSSWSAVGGGANDMVNGLVTLDLGSGSELYAVGYFTEIGGAAASGLARWNGSAWTVIPGGGTFWPVTVTAVQEEGGPALFAGGVFFSPGSPSTWGIAEWNGTSWSEIANGLNGQILSLVAYDDGNGKAFFVAGEFSRAGSIATGLVAKWDGTSWSAVGGGVEGLFAGGSLIYDDGSGPALYVGGYFFTAGGQPMSYFIRWDGSAWSPVTAGGGKGLGYAARALAVYDDGGGSDLYAGGEFLQAGNVPANRIARWDGGAWSALGLGLDGTVRALIVFDDGTGPALYAGGDFTSAGGAAASRVAKWDGHGWSPLGAGIDGTVFALEVFDDGTGPALYAGGQFFSAGGASAGSIAKWDGSTWTALGAGVTGTVLSLRAYDPPVGPARLYAGGSFGSAGGAPARYLATWNGSAWSAIPGSPDNWIYTLDVFDFGGGPTLYAGGEVPVSGPGTSVASTWNGLSWFHFATGPGRVEDFEKFDDGGGHALYEAGSFSQGGAGPHVYGVGRLETSWSTVAGGIDFLWVADLAVFDGGAGPDLFAAGLFGLSGNVASHNIARYSCRGTPTLKVPASTPAAAGGTVTIPITLDPAGVTLGGAAFSIDYDQSCLDPDANHDGTLDQFLFSAPGFTTIVQFDPLDTDGEIDVSIFDAAPPIAPLPGGQIAQVRFAITCPGPKAAAVGFSVSPSPSFGDLRANNVEGTSQSGVVQVLPGPRGDCNGDGLRGIADLTAIGLEIFDGDGDLWLDAPGSTYRGSPVGCDANASTRIQAADVTCANLLIFGGACAAPLAEPDAAAPLLELSAAGEGGIVWLRARLARNGAAVGSVAYSLDLDPVRFDLAAADRDRDGRPDHLRFPQGEPGFASVRLDAADAGGELDVLLADLAQRPLADGVLIEIGFPAARASRRLAFRLAKDPAPSFGSAAGGDLPGLAVVGSLP